MAHGKLWGGPNRSAAKSQIACLRVKEFNPRKGLKSYLRYYRPFTAGVSNKFYRSLLPGSTVLTNKRNWRLFLCLNSNSTLWRHKFNPFPSPHSLAFVLMDVLRFFQTGKLGGPIPLSAAGLSNLNGLAAAAGFGAATGALNPAGKKSSVFVKLRGKIRDQSNLPVLNYWHEEASDSKLRFLLKVERAKLLRITL